MAAPTVGDGLHHRKRIATPVCALARNDGVMWKLPRFPTDSPRPGLRRDTPLINEGGKGAPQ